MDHLLTKKNTLNYEKALAIRTASAIQGANDVRGVLDELANKDLAFKVGKCLSYNSVL